MLILLIEINQILNFSMIVCSALMICKGLIVVIGSERITGDESQRTPNSKVLNPDRIKNGDNFHSNVGNLGLSRSNFADIHFKPSNLYNSNLLVKSRSINNNNNERLYHSNHIDTGLSTGNLNSNNRLNDMRLHNLHYETNGINLPSVEDSHFNPSNVFTNEVEAKRPNNGNNNNANIHLNSVKVSKAADLTNDYPNKRIHNLYRLNNKGTSRLSLTNNNLNSRLGSAYDSNEMERSLHDSFCVVKRVIESKSVVPGGGACDAALKVYRENMLKCIMPDAEQPRWRPKMAAPTIFNNSPTCSWAPDWGRDRTMEQQWLILCGHFKLITSEQLLHKVNINFVAP